MYLAARDRHDDVIEAILASAAMRNDILTKAETSNYWRPLYIACTIVHLPILNILFEAAAEGEICDLAG